MQIHWHHMKWVGDEEKTEIEERLYDLADQGHNDLLDVRISGHPSRHRGHTDHEVKITCDAQGQEIVATESAPKIEQALHDALEKFKQQVRHMRSRRKDHRSRGRSEGPEPEPEPEPESID
ncbi:MAG: HPF/RaiA family ribosome-associated protein [Deltaproteobacteria bacterium]|nr:HPF/RaiA family ribosome-associated protein [Deltaproteobacteria bacterium]MBW2725068.1 HPF/RaiA family ribosome-associated protein [Deltaproteobacteria bacterium]